MMALGMIAVVAGVAGASAPAGWEAALTKELEAIAAAETKK